MYPINRLNIMCYILYACIHILFFSKLNHDIETMLQEKGEVDESSQNLKAQIELTERELADINNKINMLVKEMEQERNTYNSKHNALQK